MELEPATTEFHPVADERPRMLPPPPAQLVAIADVTLLAVAGIEKELDSFYVGIFGLTRDREAEQAGPGNTDAAGLLVYRTENVRLRFHIVELPPRRFDFRPLGVIVPSLSDLAQRLTEARIAFIRQRGLWAGMESLLINDPTGNLIEVTGLGCLI